MKYYLAIDIGASSGRHILGSFQNGKICYEEIYRFENNVVNENNSLVWNIDNLIGEVKKGIKKCAEIGKIPKTIAIDTWGVDYVLLDSDKKEIFPVYAYRDNRTAEVVSEIEKLISHEDLYYKTGIQKQDFNTIYQLYCDKQNGRLKNAQYFLMIPEYIAFCLTGVIKKEYTNATTTSLINVKTKQWDSDLLDILGLDKSLFLELSMPSSKVGNFTPQMMSYAGFDAEVVLCPTHDTASAVAACPISEDSIYISSGTWSLIGIESDNPIVSEAAMKANFTNEGGIEYRYRILKNIMGMWLLQNIRRDLNERYSYSEMVDLAMKSNFIETIDVNSAKLLAPNNMIDAVKELLENPNLPIEDVLNCVYHSLAKSYAQAIEEIMLITNKTFSSIQIIGGGNQNTYLNKLTAKYTGLPVFIGSSESTALGNLISQMIYDDIFIDIFEARESLKNQFEN